VNDFDAKRSTSSSDVSIVVLGLLAVASGGMRVLVDTDRMIRVLGALTLIFGVAITVIGWRGRPRLDGLSAKQRTRRSGVNAIGTGLVVLTLNGPFWSDPDRTGRVFGTYILIVGVVALAFGGLLLWRAQKRRS
jgi:hypothetical protein